VWGGGLLGKSPRGRRKQINQSIFGTNFLVGLPQQTIQTGRNFIPAFHATGVNNCGPNFLGRSALLDL